MAKKPIYQVRWYDWPAYWIYMLTPMRWKWRSRLLPYAGRWAYRNDHDVPWMGGDGLGQDYDRM